MEDKKPKSAIKSFMCKMTPRNLRKRYQQQQSRANLTSRSSSLKQLSLLTVNGKSDDQQQNYKTATLPLRSSSSKSNCDANFKNKDREFWNNVDMTEQDIELSKISRSLKGGHNVATSSSNGTDLGAKSSDRKREQLSSSTTTNFTPLAAITTNSELALDNNNLRESEKLENGPKADEDPILDWIDWDDLTSRLKEQQSTSSHDLLEPTITTLKEKLAQKDRPHEFYQRQTLEKKAGDTNKKVVLGLQHLALEAAKLQLEVKILKQKLTAIHKEEEKENNNCNDEKTLQDNQITSQNRSSPKLLVSSLSLLGISSLLIAGCGYTYHKYVK